MFEIKLIVMLYLFQYLYVFDIYHQIISLYKHMQHMLLNVYYLFVILLIKNKQRKMFWSINKLSLFSFRITKNDLIPHAQTMYDSFFRILTSEKSYENEYVMRAVMRLSSALQDGVLPYLNQLIDKLVMILRRSSKVKNFDCE